MNVIDVKDGGLAVAKTDTRSITVGVIQLVVAAGDAEPETITGYCRREAKQGILNVIKQIIWEQPTP